MQQGLQVLLVSVVVLFGPSLPQVKSHGRLIEPPSRASMWRYGFNTPPNYNDHELYCGGYTRQWQKNGGKCGICGDPWDSPQPRAHEAGGKYGLGVISRKYKMGSSFTIRVELTANHRGYFEFRLCPNNAPKQVSSQNCLDKFILQRAKAANRAADDILHETRFYPGPENKVYELRYMLPKTVSCRQCVLQWRYIAGNNWGLCPNGTGMVGCGPQEEFRACADIAIEDGTGTVDETPFEEVTDNVIPDVTESIDDNELDLVNRQREEGWWLFTLAIAFSALVFAIIVYALLYFYFYHAGDTVKRWLSGKEECFGFKNKMDNLFGNSAQAEPVPPPRTKKLMTTIGFKGVPDNLV